MPSPFDQISFSDAVGRLQEGTPEWVEVNERYYNGDHWEDGEGWIGPRPMVGEQGYSETMSEIERSFISRNVFQEVVDRHANAILGREPKWELTPRRAFGITEDISAEEETLIDEAEAALTAWWDGQEVHQVLQTFGPRLLLAGRANLRLFVPPGMVVNGRVPPGDLETSFSRIYAQCPEVSQSFVYTDPDTMQKLGIYIGEREDGEQDLELVYLDDLRRTVVRTEREGRTLTRREGPGFSQLVPVDLGGRLTIGQATRRPLITPQVLSNQRLINEALTMLQRNVVLGGFLERVLLNAQFPGEWIEDETAPGGKRFKPSEFKVGAGSINFIQGSSFVDETGVTKVLNPSIHYRDPVPTDTFEATIKRGYRNILEETAQLHALITGDATPSGDSRRQALYDFLVSLRKTRVSVKVTLTWFLETALKMAAVFSGDPTRYDGLRIVADTTLDAGPLSAEEVRLAIELYDKGIIPLEEAMVRGGIEDTDAALVKINAEWEARIARRQMLFGIGLRNSDPATQPTNMEGQANGQGANAGGEIQGAAQDRVAFSSNGSR